MEHKQENKMGLLKLIIVSSIMGSLFSCAPSSQQIKDAIAKDPSIVFVAIEKDPEKKQALMNFVIVGGGPTGVETAGALSELKNHVLIYDYPELDIDKMQIYLIEGSERILSPFF